MVRVLRRMEQGDWQYKEQDKEQDGEEDREVDADGGCSGQFPLEPDQEEKLRRPHSHFSRRQTAKSLLRWLQVSLDP